MHTSIANFQSNRKGQKAAIVFVPYVTNIETLPLAPAVIKSTLMAEGITQVSLVDANLVWQRKLDSLSNDIGQELFNFSQGAQCYPLSAEAAEAAGSIEMEK